MSYIGFGIVHSDQPFTIDEHTGDGLSTVFTLSTPKPIVARAVIVTVDGVVQDPGALNSYDLDANGDLEFSEAPENLASIRVLHLGRKYDLAVPMDGSVTPIKIAPDSNGDFHFDTDTLYIDYFNDRVGINTNTPQFALDVVGDIHASGNITADGNITLGDADTDSITLNADITSNILPDVSSTYTLGSATKTWDAVFADNFTLNTQVTETPATGQLYWNSDFQTLEVGLENGVSLELGQKHHFYVKAGEAISKGNVVYASGAVGNSAHMEVSKYIANHTIEERTVVGIASQDIALGDFGYVTTFGNVRGVSADGSAVGETWNTGDILYASYTTAGALTNSKPPAPNQAIAIAFVLNNHATNGDIVVRAYDPGFHLDEIHDVDLSTPPTDGQGIIWDNASGTWIAGDSFNQADFNTAIAAVSIGDLTDVDITTTAPNVGQLLKWNGTNFAPADDQEDLTNNSIGDLGDVDITSVAPTDEQVLIWDAANSQFIPGDAAADFTDLTGQIAASQIPNDIITNAMLNYTVNVFSQEFTADGINNTYTLTSDPGSKNALQIFVDGVPQRASNYTVVGTTLTLGGTPTNGQLVEVRGYGVVQPIGTVADNSITGAKIQDGTIDLNKIAPSDYYAADTFTGDGNTASYTLSTDPGSPWAITVFVAGVWQKPVDNYTVSSTTLTFTSNIANGEEVYVRYYGVALAVGTVADDSITGAKIQDGSITANKIAGSEYLTQSFTGDGNSTDFTLSSDPGAQQALLVLIDNVIQVPVTNYTVTGTTLAFTGAPDLNADIFVRYLGLPSPLVTVADNSISTAKLQDNSISTAKLQDTSVSTAKLQDNSISTAKLQDTSVSTAKLQDTSVSTAKLQD